MTIIAAGIDLAKNVFAVHGVNEAGAVQLRQPKVSRGKLNALVATLPPCVIAMEACSGAHHWARQFQAHGHSVRLIAPKLVAPYRMSGKRGKNDAADAAAICEAVQRPNMRFVPVKTEEQQSRLMVHRARQGYVAARTACINRIRGLLSEFGVVLPLKAEVVRRQAREHLEDLPGYANLVIGDLLSEVHHLDERIPQYDVQGQPYPGKSALVLPSNLKSLRNQPASVPAAYPAGHATLVFVAAEIFATVFPKLRDEFQRRAERVAENRIVAGFHFKSDIEAGRVLANKLLPRIHAYGEIKALIAKAKTEWASS